MRIAQSLAAVDVKDSTSRPAYTLEEGQRYVLYDQEVQAGIAGGVLVDVCGLDRELPCYRSGGEDAQSILLPFIGRLGDALVTAACLKAHLVQKPYDRFTIATNGPSADLLSLVDVPIDLTRYPLLADKLDAFDAYMSFEYVESVQQGSSRSLFDVFSECLNTTKPVEPARLRFPDDATPSMLLDDLSGPVVGIHFGDPASYRCYPHDRSRTLANLLVENGVTVVFLGTETGPSFDRTSCGEAKLIDLRGKTPRMVDFLATLALLDLLIAGDSMPLHAAGALNVEVLSLFISSSAVIASDYKCASVVHSNAPCAPCGAVCSPCPVRNRYCLAGWDESISPEVVLYRTLELLQKERTPAIEYFPSSR